MKRTFLIVIFLTLIIAACDAIPPAPQPTNSPAAEIQEEAALPTETQPLPTDTPVPSLTSTPTLVPTDTSTPAPEVCDQAALVAQGYLEAPAELGAPVPPGTEFTYILRVTNTGTCTWTSDYAVVLVDNQGLVVDDAQPFTVTAVPGQTVDIPVQVAAPEDDGSFSASWQFRNAEGETFGYGITGEGVFTLSITVGDYVAGGGSTDSGFISSCDVAKLMFPVYKDVPVYDGSSVHPNQTFTAGWRLKNVGTCTWNKNYSIVLVQSDGIVASVTQPFSEVVAPGETIDVTFKLTAPSKPGTYNLVWRLKNGNGEFFGFGSNGTGKFTLNFSVLDLPSGWHFDFVAARCQAQWHSYQVSFLPCDSKANDKLGYVRYLEDPSLEGKSSGNQPVINVNPDNGKHGFIKGIFPPYLIQDGDKFVARIGCMGGNPDCRILFELMIIKPNGEVAIIADWTETSNGDTRLVKVDLSKWAGKEVQFVLFMKNNGGRTADADGFWQFPRIENTSAP